MRFSIKYKNHPYAVVYYLLFLLLPLNLSAQTAFKTCTWQELEALSRSTQKPIFVEVYTEWCKPCKLMMQNTFPHEKLGHFLNTYTLPYRLDAEKCDTALLSRLHVRTYPHLALLSPDGNIAWEYVSYLDPEVLLDFLQGEMGISAQKVAYQAYPDSLPILLNYLNEIRTSKGEEVQQIISQYLVKKASEKRYTSENASFLEYLSWKDSAWMQRIFEEELRKNAEQDSLLFPVLAKQLSGMRDFSLRQKKAKTYQKFARYQASMDRKSFNSTLSLGEYYAEIQDKNSLDSLIKIAGNDCENQGYLLMLGFHKLPYVQVKALQKELRDCKEMSDGKLLIRFIEYYYMQKYNEMDTLSKELENINLSSYQREVWQSWKRKKEKKTGS